MRTILAILIALAIEAHASAQALWWDASYKARRPVAVYVPEINLPGDDAAVVTFFTGGLARPDGSDIRVVARGRELPCVLYGMGPGDSATIAFKVDRDTRDHYIYFGSAAAAVPNYSWQPQRGLILQTRKYNGGDAKNLAQMRDIWRASAPFHGAGPVDTIWHGQNMFGPSDAFSSLYTGWLMCRTQGEYSFATSSDDASFLLIDSKPVASWPGFHGPVADARHNGKVSLKPGLHRLDYLHLSAGGTTCAVAAWRPPGADAFEVIPETAFAPLSRAVVGPLEINGQRLAPDFDFEITGEALMSKTEDVYAVKLAFANTSAGRQSNAVYWDFGDGQKATGPSVEHIYLASGVYSVTMRLGAAQTAPSVTNGVNVHQHWGWQTRKDIDEIESYFPIISRCDVELLDAASLVNLLKLADEQGSVDFAKRVAVALISRAGDAGGVEFAVARLRDILGPSRLASDDRLIAAYSAAFKSATGQATAALALALCDIYLERGQPSEAADVTKAALAGNIDDPTRRRLFIAYADAQRYLGDAAAAENALKAASEISLRRTSLQDVALAGAIAFKAEDYIATKGFAAAEDALDQWDWEKPLEKLEGYSSYLRARVYQGQARDSRALRELDAIVAVSPESAYAPKALLLAAKIHQSKGNRDAAKAALDKIMSDYKTSPEASDARRMLLSF